jgi:hypothetical protein
VGLRVLDLPVVGRSSFDTQGLVLEVDVHRLQSEALAGPEPGLHQCGEQCGVAAIGRGLREERVTVLPRQRPDLLKALGLGQRFGLLAALPPGAERGIRGEVSVVNGVGEHGREGGPDQPHGVLRVARLARGHRDSVAGPPAAILRTGAMCRSSSTVVQENGEHHKQPLSE